MIIKNSKCLVGDNTGIKKIKCINISKQRAKIGSLGDLIVFSINKIKKKKSYVKKKIYSGLIINVRKKKKRLDGSYISFKQNSIITLTENRKPLGTRLLFPLSKEIVKGKLKNDFFKKIISSSKFII